MEENHFKAFYFFLKLVLLLHLMYSVNKQYEAETTNQPRFYYIYLLYLGKMQTKCNIYFKIVI